jgi:hypothetical protein
MKNMRMAAFLVLMIGSIVLSAAAQAPKRWTYQGSWQGKTVTIIVTEGQSGYGVSGDIIEPVYIGNMQDKVCDIQGRYVPETGTLTANCGSIVISASKTGNGNSLNVRLESNNRMTEFAVDRIANRPEKAPDILGTWNSNTTQKYRYTLVPDGYDFAWYLSEIREQGKISVKGDILSASWSNQKTSGSATGRITTVDANNRATRIEWSNGVIFTR